MPDSSCKLHNLNLHNPLVLASGVIGTSVSVMKRAARSGAGAITAKSCGPEARAGHPNPVTVDWGPGILNAIGLTNPGAENEIHLLVQTRKALEPLGVPLIASMFAGTVEQYGEVARILADANPHMIEVNISCPNVHDEFGTPFAGLVESAAAVTGAVRRAVNIPISIKLAPNVPNLALIGRAVEEAGADAITAINTMPGMVIDAHAGKAVLSNKTGGVSGPALKPVALRCVAELYRSVNIPIIGTGGVTTGLDAVEMIMAGAAAVGVGTAVWYRGVGVFQEIVTEMEAFMHANNYPDLASMRGIAVQ